MTTESAPRHILVAEDDDEFRALLVHALSLDGHHVIEVEDGFELADFVEMSTRESTTMPAPPHKPAAPKPDLILTDVRMPGLTGLQGIAQARAAGLVCPILVLTAFPDDSLEEEAQRLGATRVVGKPIELPVLRQLVLELLASG